MRRPKLTFKNKPITEQVGLARRVQSSLTEKPALAARVTRLGEFQSMLAEAETSVLAVEAAKSAWKAELTQRNRVLRQLRTVTRSVALELQVAGVSETELQEAGFDLARPRTPIGTLPMPENVHAESGEHDGSVQLTWDVIRVRGPLYEIQMREEPDGPWRHVETRSRRNCVIRNLVPGRLYGFRVAGLGAAGRGPWSHVAHARAK